MTTPGIKGYRPASHQENHDYTANQFQYELGIDNKESFPIEESSSLYCEVTGDETGVKIPKPIEASKDGDKNIPKETAKAKDKMDAAVIDFKGREIDLNAYLVGFPYTAPFVDLRTGHMFYKKKGKIDELMMQTFDVGTKDKVDFSKGRVISQRDFSKRNLWGIFYSPLTNKVIMEVDDKNDEVINFYELDPETGVEKKISTTAYIYGFDLSDDGRYVAFTTRSSKDELSPGDVRVLDLVTGKEKVIYKDSNEIKMVWGNVSWQPNGMGVMVSFIASGSRQKRNLLYVPLDPSKKAQVITDTSKRRNELDPLNRWLNNEEFLYTSDEADFKGVYKASLKDGEAKLVSTKGENIKSAALIKDGDQLHLGAVIGDPLKSTLKMISPATGGVWYEKMYPGKVNVNAVHNDRLALYSQSLSNPFTEVEIHIVDKKVTMFDRAAYPDELLGKIINCEPEKVSFETFDKISAPGENGTLHAYLLKPKRPRSGNESRALVEAFYGGGNDFFKTYQMLCDAGYYVMAPAPRGTEDFGGAFYDMAGGDWGGGETLDDFAAAKFLQKRFGIPARHIGIFGGSRGGYDTLRAMTFPGEVNGVKEDFRFGFGISDYGIADIVRATDGGNISQWFAYLTGGDPHKDAAKWRERSPETHADLLSGPLLLTHGSNDNRIPVTESRSMYAKLKSMGKEVYFLEIPNEGHGYKGVESLMQYYKTVFEFLSKIDD